MAYQTIRYEPDEQGILTLTLNRPEKLNAFNRDMMTEMIDALDRADADDDIRVIIVTGAGRGFCAGADLSSGSNTFDADAREDRKSGVDRDGGGQLTLRIFDSNKPIIAAVNGPAVGVGVTMQLAMDVRIASQSARFGFVFSRRGIVPEACSSWFLPRIVGISQALQWCYSGRVFDAEEALRGGLISQITPREALMEQAREIASGFMHETAPVSVSMTRHMMWKMLGADHPMEAHKVDSRAIYYRGRSADAHEGVDAFLSKREAVFPDKPSQDMPEFFPWWQPAEFK